MNFHDHQDSLWGLASFPLGGVLFLHSDCLMTQSYKCRSFLLARLAGEIRAPMMGSMSTTSSPCSFGSLSAALGDIMVLVLASMLLLPMAANTDGTLLAMLPLCFVGGCLAATGWLLGSS